MKKEHTHARRVDALPADGCAVMVRAYFTAAGCMLAAPACAASLILANRKGACHD